MNAFYLSAALTVLVLAGCSKNDDATPNTAGSGGPASLRVSLVHQGVTVDSGRVRIRYNATTPPADRTYGYNDSVDVTRFDVSTAQALFPRLRKGRYYIDATGYLPLTAFNAPRIVTGGVAYLLTDTAVVNLTIQLDNVVR